MVKKANEGLGMLGAAAVGAAVGAAASYLADEKNRKTAQKKIEHFSEIAREKLDQAKASGEEIKSQVAEGGRQLKSRSSKH